MNPPSEVTVLSLSDPLPLLPDVVDTSSSSLLAGREASICSAIFEVGALGVVGGIDNRRASERPFPFTTLDAGEAVGVTDLAGCFRGVSKSRFLRFGEWVPSKRRCSPKVLEPVLRERLLDNDALPCLGLPPDRGFPGTAMAADLGRVGLAREGGLLLCFRSSDGGGLMREALGEKLSSTALTSAGMGIWWILLTDRQSAAWIRRCSEADGGRQHPGHPGLLYIGF